MDIVCSPVIANVLVNRVPYVITPLPLVTSIVIVNSDTNSWVTLYEPFKSSYTIWICGIDWPTQYNAWYELGKLDFVVIIGINANGAAVDILAYVIGPEVVIYITWIGFLNSRRESRSPPVDNETHLRSRRDRPEAGGIVDRCYGEWLSIYNPDVFA